MRRFLAGLALAVVAGGAAALLAAAEDAQVRVYKTSTCGCCTKWVNHLRSRGFSVEATDVEDLERVKLENGIPQRLASCHTAFVEGYFVEGHVPAEDVERLLAERPRIAGLAVPGMPIGSPGMEGPDPERYQVLALGLEGEISVFATHGP
jgi:hypothetical protein